MIQKIKKFFQNNPFFKDSALLTVVNLLSGSVNFILQFIVLQYFSSLLSLWQSLSSVTNLLTTLFTGMTAEIVKNSSNFFAKNPALARFYFTFTRSHLFRYLFWSTALIPFLVILLDPVIKTQQPILLAVVLFNFILGLFFSLNQSFLLGILALKNFTISIVLNTILRITLTLTLLFLGFDVWSLALGNVLPAAATYFYNEFQIKQIFQNQTLSELEESDFKQNYAEFKIGQTLIKFLLSGFITFFTSLFFQLSILVNRSIFLDETSRQQFAFIAFFGQIIYFGCLSFLGAFIPHATRAKDHKIFSFSYLLVLGVSSFGGLIIFLFDDLVFYLFQRDEFKNLSGLIFLNAVFVGLFLAINTSTQYLIVQSRYKLASSIVFFTSFLAISFALLKSQENQISGFLNSMSNQNWVKFLGFESTLETSPLLAPLILMQLFFAILVAIFYFVLIIRSKKF